MLIIANIPEELIALVQWLIWRYIQKPGEQKPAKVPHNTMGYPCDATNPENWSKFEHALKAAARPGFCDGIGFVFSPDDPYCGIDLDNIWQSDADEGAPWAMGILDRFSDTYSEVSPSDHGVKIWCRAHSPRSGSWKVESGQIEIYSERRFFAVTGRSGGVHVIADHQSDIEQLVAHLDGDHHQGHPPQIDGVIPYGTQHNTLVSLAGTMHRRGMSPAAILAALLEVNQSQCERPGPKEHIWRIVESMQRWER